MHARFCGCGDRVTNRIEPREMISLSDVSGVARGEGGGQKGQLPPLFSDSPRPLVIRACMHVGKIRLARETTIGHVVTLGDEQTQRGIIYWLRRLRNIERRNAPTPRSHLERKILVGELFLLTRAPPRTATLPSPLV